MRFDGCSFEKRSRGELRDERISVAARDRGLGTGSPSASSFRLARRSVVGVRLSRRGFGGSEVICVGVVDSGVGSRWPLTLFPFEACRLALLASRRLTTLELLVVRSVTSSLDSLWSAGALVPTSTSLVGAFSREGAATKPLSVGLARFSSLSSDSATQSSVRLRHMLSALRRTWRSAELDPPNTDAALCIVPCGPLYPVIAAKARASVAVASNARYTSRLTRGLHFAKVECKSG